MSRLDQADDERKREREDAPALPDVKKCPWAKSEMTPCVVKDGKDAMADDGACVGCNRFFGSMGAVRRVRQQLPQQLPPSPCSVADGTDERVNSVSDGDTDESQVNDPGGSRTRDLRIKRSSIEPNEHRPPETADNHSGGFHQPVSTGLEGSVGHGVSMSGQSVSAAVPAWVPKFGYSLRLLGDPVLRQVCEEFAIEDREYLLPLVDAMTAEIRKYHGAGLAANQVGATVRVAVVIIDQRPVTLINPIITGTSFDKKRAAEGCLSVPGFEVHLTRTNRVTVQFLDESFTPRKLSVAFLEARAVQHELEHLDGRLIIDGLSPRRLAVAEQLVERAKARRV